MNRIMNEFYLIEFSLVPLEWFATDEEREIYKLRPIDPSE